jgi:hypothetical protein
MSKHNILRRVALLCLVVAHGALGTQALAGSIVINNPPQPQPKKANEVKNSSGSVAPADSYQDELMTNAVERWLHRQSDSGVESYSFETSESGESVAVSWQSQDVSYSEQVPVHQLLSLNE